MLTKIDLMDKGTDAVDVRVSFTALPMIILEFFISLFLELCW